MSSLKVAEENNVKRRCGREGDSPQSVYLALTLSMNLFGDLTGWLDDEVMVRDDK